MATQYALINADQEAPAAQEPSAELARLAAEIRWLEEQAQLSARTALAHKVDIGLRLVRAKDLLDHGEFLPWAKKEFGWAQPHVWRHMELARNHTRVNDLAPDVSWREITRALKDQERAVDEPVPTGMETVVPADEEDTEPEPDAQFWAARDGLLALRNEAQALANRFGLECYPDDAGWVQLDGLTKGVKEATQALERLAAVLSSIRLDRERRGGKRAPRPPRQTIRGGLSEQDRTILAAVQARGSATSLDVSEATGLPVYVVSARLSEMKRAGSIRWTGKKVGAAFVYEVPDAAA